MLDIAYLYANHHWAAAETNLSQLQYPIPSDSNRFNIYDQLLELGGAIKYFGDPSNGDLLSRTFMNTNPVITPNWISLTEYNIGVPYAWGLSSGLRATQRDLETPINPSMQAVYIPVAESIRASTGCAGYFVHPPGFMRLNKVKGSFS